MNTLTEHATLAITATIAGGRYTVTAHRYSHAGWGDETLVGVHTLSQDPALDGLPAVSTVRLPRLLSDEQALAEFVDQRDWLANPRDLMWHRVDGVDWTPLAEPAGPVAVRQPGPRLDWDEVETSGGVYRVAWDPEGVSTVTLPAGDTLRLLQRPLVAAGRKVHLTTAPAVAGGYQETRHTGPVATHVRVTT